MATAATLDTIRNNSQTETKNGWRILRTAVVTGATGSGPAKIFNAASLGSIPQVGDTHPEITAAKVTARTPRALGAGVVEIGIVYEEDRKKKTDAEDPTGDGGASVQVGTRLQSEYTNLDRDGKFVVLTLTGERDQPGGVNVLKPQTTLNIARREATDPSDRSVEFVGSVNTGGQFAIAGSKQEAGTWLCTAIEGTKEVAGTYIVSYSFELKEKIGTGKDAKGGWQPEVIYNDPKTGLPHVKVAGPDATEANKLSGQRTFLAYPEKNFNALQLSE